MKMSFLASIVVRPTLCVLLVLLVACNKTIEKTTATKPKNTKKAPVLVFAENMNQKSAYENIKGNIPRLKAMMSGKFVQYSTVADRTTEGYTPWLVNDDNDSVLVYTLPVGDPNRQGHWMYVSQIMTSLPNEPIYGVFVELVSINRDSIKANYYDVPKDFPYSFDQILEDPVDLFKDFDFENLPVSKEEKTVYYERETPIKFIGRSEWIDDEDGWPRVENGYNRDLYIITPTNYLFGTEVFDQDKKLVKRVTSEKLMRHLMLAEPYLGR